MNKIKTIRPISLALAAMLVILSSASCGGGTAVDDTPGSAAGDATSEAVTADTAEKAEIPDVDYNGYEFRILGGMINTDTSTSEIAAETETGETLNDSVYNRNRMTEEKLGVKSFRFVTTAAMLSLLSAAPCLRATTTMTRQLQN